MQPQAAGLAGRIADAYVNVSSEDGLVERFEEGGSRGKPKYGQVTCCYPDSKDKAKELAFEVWANAAIEGLASQELPYPEHFEAAAKIAGPDDLVGGAAARPRPGALPRADPAARFLTNNRSHLYRDINRGP